RPPLPPPPLSLHDALPIFLTPELAYVVTHMLEGTIERGTGAAAKALGRPAAAKTGTTNDYSNAWFIGYTPRLSTGVWVGYDRPRSEEHTSELQSLTNLVCR